MRSRFQSGPLWKVRCCSDSVDVNVPPTLWSSPIFITSILIQTHSRLTWSWKIRVLPAVSPAIWSPPTSDITESIYDLIYYVPFLFNDIKAVKSIAKVAATSDVTVSRREPCTVSQLLRCQASPVHVLVSCDVVWPPVSLTLCVWGEGGGVRSSKSLSVGSKLLFCRGHGRFVNSWPVRWGKKPVALFCQLKKTTREGAGWHQHRICIYTLYTDMTNF